MVIINLLPWRDAQYQYQLRQLLKYGLGSFALALLVLTAWHLHLQNKSERLRAQLNLLNEASPSGLNEKAQAEQMQEDEVRLAKLRAIEHDNEKLRQFFMLFSSEESRAVCFTRIMRQHQALILEGRTQSSNALTLFLKNWRLTSIFTELQLQRLVKSNQTETMQFQLKVKM